MAKAAASTAPCDAYQQHGERQQCCWPRRRHRSGIIEQWHNDAYQQHGEWQQCLGDGGGIYNRTVDIDAYQQHGERQQALLAAAAVSTTFKNGGTSSNLFNATITNNKPVVEPAAVVFNAVGRHCSTSRTPFSLEILQSTLRMRRDYQFKW